MLLLMFACTLWGVACSSTPRVYVTVVAAHDSITSMPVYLLQTSTNDTILAIMDPRFFGIPQNSTTTSKSAVKLGLSEGEQGWVRLRELRKADRLSVDFIPDLAGTADTDAFILYDIADSLQHRPPYEDIGGYSSFVPMRKVRPVGVRIIEGPVRQVD